ncbi:hypothetical protein RI367_006960 [Sorochytrium milnesiophthora]
MQPSYRPPRKQRRRGQLWFPLSPHIDDQASTAQSASPDPTATSDGASSSSPTPLLTSDGGLPRLSSLLRERWSHSTLRTDASYFEDSSFVQSVRTDASFASTSVYSRSQASADRSGASQDYSDASGSQDDERGDGDDDDDYALDDGLTAEDLLLATDIDLSIGDLSYMTDHSGTSHRSFTDTEVVEDMLPSSSASNGREDVSSLRTVQTAFRVPESFSATAAAAAVGNLSVDNTYPAASFNKHLLHDDSSHADPPLYATADKHHDHHHHHHHPHATAASSSHISQHLKHRISGTLSARVSIEPPRPVDKHHHHQHQHKIDDSQQQPHHHVAFSPDLKASEPPLALAQPAAAKKPSARKRLFHSPVVRVFANRTKRLLLLLSLLRSIFSTISTIVSIARAIQSPWTTLLHASSFYVASLFFACTDLIFTLVRLSPTFLACWRPVVEIYKRVKRFVKMRCSCCFQQRRRKGAGGDDDSMISLGDGNDTANRSGNFSLLNLSMLEKADNKANKVKTNKLSIWSLVSHKMLLMDMLPLLPNVILKIYEYRMSELTQNPLAPVVLLAAPSILPDQLSPKFVTNLPKLLSPQFSKLNSPTVQLYVFIAALYVTIASHGYNIARTLVKRKKARWLAALVALKCLLLTLDISVAGILLYQLLVLRGFALFGYENTLTRDPSIVNADAGNPLRRLNIFEIQMPSDVQVMLSVIAAGPFAAVISNAVVNVAMHYLHIVMVLKDRVFLLDRASARRAARAKERERRARQQQARTSQSGMLEHSMIELPPAVAVSDADPYGRSLQRTGHASSGSLAAVKITPENDDADVAVAPTHRRGSNGTMNLRRASLASTSFNMLSQDRPARQHPTMASQQSTARRPSAHHLVERVPGAATLEQVPRMRIFRAAARKTFHPVTTALFGTYALFACWATWYVLGPLVRLPTSHDAARIYYFPGLGAGSSGDNTGEPLWQRHTPNLNAFGVLQQYLTQTPALGGSTRANVSLPGSGPDWDRVLSDDAAGRSYQQSVLLVASQRAPNSDGGEHHSLNATTFNFELDQLHPFFNNVTNSAPADVDDFVVYFQVDRANFLRHITYSNLVVNYAAGSITALGYWMYIGFVALGMMRVLNWTKRWAQEAGLFKKWRRARRWLSKRLGATGPRRTQSPSRRRRQDARDESVELSNVVVAPDSQPHGTETPTTARSSVAENSVQGLHRAKRERRHSSLSGMAAFEPADAVAEIDIGPLEIDIGVAGQAVAHVHNHARRPSMDSSRALMLSPSTIASSAGPLSAGTDTVLVNSVPTSSGNLVTIHIPHAAAATDLGLQPLSPPHDDLQPQLEQVVVLQVGNSAPVSLTIPTNTDTNAAAGAPPAPIIVNAPQTQQQPMSPPSNILSPLFREQLMSPGMSSIGFAEHAGSIHGSVQRSEHSAHSQMVIRHPHLHEHRHHVHHHHVVHQLRQQQHHEAVDTLETVEKAEEEQQRERRHERRRRRAEKEERRRSRQRNVQEKERELRQRRRRASFDVISGLPKGLMPRRSLSFRSTSDQEHETDSDESIESGNASLALSSVMATATTTTTTTTTSTSNAAAAQARRSSMIVLQNNEASGSVQERRRSSVVRILLQVGNAAGNLMHGGSAPAAEAAPAIVSTATTPATAHALFSSEPAQHVDQQPIHNTAPAGSTSPLHLDPAEMTTTTTTKTTTMVQYKSESFNIGHLRTSKKLPQRPALPSFPFEARHSSESPSDSDNDIEMSDWDLITDPHPRVVADPEPLAPPAQDDEDGWLSEASTIRAHPRQGASADRPHAYHLSGQPVMHSSARGSRHLRGARGRQSSRHRRGNGHQLQRTFVPPADDEGWE